MTATAVKPTAVRFSRTGTRSFEVYVNDKPVGTVTHAPDAVWSRWIFGGTDGFCRSAPHVTSLRAIVTAHYRTDAENALAQGEAFVNTVPSTVEQVYGGDGWDHMIFADGSQLYRDRDDTAGAWELRPTRQKG